MLATIVGAPYRPSRVQPVIGGLGRACLPAIHHNWFGAVTPPPSGVFTLFFLLFFLFFLFTVTRERETPVITVLCFMLMHRGFPYTLGL